MSSAVGGAGGDVETAEDTAETKDAAVDCTGGRGNISAKISGYTWKNFRRTASVAESAMPHFL